jgi:hypothetical protein
MLETTTSIEKIFNSAITNLVNAPEMTAYVIIVQIIDFVLQVGEGQEVTLRYVWTANLLFERCAPKRQENTKSDGEDKIFQTGK